MAGLFLSKPVALGMLLGVAAGFFRLKLSAKALLRFADTDGAGRSALVGQRLMNFALVGAVLFVAFSTPQLDQWAALAGVLLPNVIIVLDTLGRGTGEEIGTDVDEPEMDSRVMERT
ncbi:MAG: hypothetical protein GXP25_04040 [Planctomycetes bacterium]|nr:hypothetical protein [Planctomycetota bacterium]